MCMTQIYMSLLTRLCLDLSQINEYKFRDSFTDTVSSLCDCDSETESMEQFLLLFFCQEKYSSQKAS